jgi:hypothetical protein
MYKEIEVYMNDMMDKSKKEENFVQVLRKSLERLRSKKLRCKHAKCMLIWSSVWEVIGVCGK